MRMPIGSCRTVVGCQQIRCNLLHGKDDQVQFCITMCFPDAVPLSLKGSNLAHLQLRVGDGYTESTLLPADVARLSPSRVRPVAVGFGSANSYTDNHCKLRYFAFPQLSFWIWSKFLAKSTRSGPTAKTTVYADCKCIQDICLPRCVVQLVFPPNWMKNPIKAILRTSTGNASLVCCG